jgi:hypothetical protein
VTKVEECTNAEIGVGAAIAAGNHLLNGKKADFVIEPTKINKIIMYPTLKKSALSRIDLKDKSNREYDEFNSIKEIKRRKILSPKRLVIRVIRAE